MGGAEMSAGAGAGGSDAGASGAGAGAAGSEGRSRLVGASIAIKFVAFFDDFLNH